MLEHRKCSCTTQKKVLIYYHISSNTTWRLVTVKATNNSSITHHNRLQASINQLCINFFIPVIVKVHLCSCYAYYATAANLDTLYPPVKILALQISINICNTYMHPLQKNLYVLIWISILLIYSEHCRRGTVLHHWHQLLLVDTSTNVLHSIFTRDLTSIEGRSTVSFKKL